MMIVQVHLLRLIFAVGVDVVLAVLLGHAPDIGTARSRSSRSVSVLATSFLLRLKSHCLEIKEKTKKEITFNKKSQHDWLVSTKKSQDDNEHEAWK